MVIDFHTHIFADSIVDRAIESLAGKCKISPSFDGSAKGLREKMKKSGVDYSVFMPVVTKPTQTRTVNTWAKSEYKDGLIAFGGIHPLNENYKELIDEACCLGLKGIKMHPDYQDFFVDDEKMYPLYDYIFSKNLILLFHAGIDIGLPSPYHCPPDRLKRMLNSFKGAKIVAAHLGGFRMWDGVLGYLAGEDIYFDISMGSEYYSFKTLETIIQNHDENKILFGSDSPWSDSAKEIEAIHNYPLSRDIKDKILYKNALALLGEL